jgi:hypothetical protein
MKTVTPTHELGAFVEMVEDTPVFRLRPSAPSVRSWFFAELGGREVFRPDFVALRAVIVEYQNTGASKERQRGQDVEPV